MMRALKWSGIGAGAMVALAVLMLLALQAGPVRLAILHGALDSALGKYEITMRAERTGGFWPWNMHLRDVTLTDAEGTFAELDEVELSLRPFAFFSGRIDIPRARVGAGTYLRRPVVPEQEDKPFRLPRLPENFGLPYDIHLGALTLGPIESHAGEMPVTLEGGGTLRLTDQGIDGDITITAGDAGRLHFAAQGDAQTRALDLTFELEDAQGAWLVPLTPLAPGTPVTAHLVANGPADNIVLSARGQVGDARFEAGGALAWGDALGIEIAGTLNGVVPQGSAAIAGNEQRFAVHATLNEDGSLDLANLGAGSTTFTLAASGRLGADVDLSGQFRSLAPQALAARAWLDGLDALGAEFSMGGTASSPTLVVRAVLEGVTRNNVRVESVTAGLDAAWSRDGERAEAIISVLTSEIAGEDLPADLRGETAAMRAEIAADFAGRSARVQHLSGAWGPFGLQAEGQLAAEAPMRFAGALAVDDLARLDTSVAGRAEITFDARRSRRGRPIEVALDAATSEFSAAGRLGRVLGGTPHIVAEVLVHDEGVDITTATARAAAAQATLSGSLFGETRDLTLRGEYALTDLGAVEDTLSGSAGGTLLLTGSSDAPQIDVTATSPALGVGVAQLDGFDARIRALADEGEVRMTARANGEPISVVLPFTRQGNDLRGQLTAALSSLAVEGPVSYVGGEPAADLVAHAEDVGPLVRLVRQIGGVESTLDASGSAEGTFTLQGRDADVQLSLTAPELAGLNTPAHAARIDLAGTVNLGIHSALETTLTAEALSFGPSEFQTAEARVAGPFTGLEATIALRGPRDNPFTLDVTATRHEHDRGSAIVLSSAHGQSFNFSIDLAEPATLIIGPEGTELGETTFNVANTATGSTGTLGAQARLWAGAPFAHVTADNVPAGALAVFGLPVDWTGTLNGDVTLDSAGDVPLVAQIHMAGLTNDPDVAPLDARVDMEVSGGELHGSVALTDTATAASLADARVTMPLIWPRGALSPHLDWDAPLTGRADIDADLERLWLFVPVDTMTVGGQATSQINIAGTLAQPQVTGALNIANGSAEHFQTGFVLQDGEGALSFNEAGDLVADLRGSDGNGGRVRLEATAHLPRAENWSVEGRLHLNDMMVARRDEVRAQASGELNLAGTIDDARLEGTLTVTRVDAQIPNQLPPSVVELPVVRVGEDGERLDPDTDDEGERGVGLPLDLDVTVNVPNRAFVRGRGLDSEWGGSLHVGGTLQGPRIEGQLNVLRGTFDLSRSRFTIDEGRISFDGGDRIDPVLYVHAEAPGPEFTSIVEVSGRMRQLSLNISSDPARPEEDVMAQILFGKRPEELTAIELVQIAQATATLSGRGGGFDVFGSARQTLGLDFLSVDAGGGEGGTGNASVSLGRYIFPNVYVGTRQGLTPGTGAVTVEVGVTDDITVDAEVRQDAESSVGVDWRWDY